MSIVTSSGSAWSPDTSAIHAADVVPDALILNLSTVSGAINGDEPVLNVGYIQDTAATFTAEAAPIDVSNPSLATTPVYSGKVTVLSRLSREIWEQDNTAKGMADSLSRSIMKKADEALLRQAAAMPPAFGPSTGLLNVSGLETTDAVANDFDALIDLVAQLESNGAAPSHIVLDPLAYASLCKFKVGTGSNQSLVGAGVEAAERRLLGLPVIVSSAMTANSGLVVDKTQVVSAVGPVLVGYSEHLYYGSDEIAVRALWRIGQSVVRPDRLGKFTVTDPDA